VLDAQGVLWLLDAQRGNLIRMTDAPQIVQAGVADPAGGRLVMADKRPVVIDLTAGTATVINPDDGSTGGAACVDVDPADTTVHVLGSSIAAEVYAVSGGDGVLRITDLDTGDCSATVPGIAPTGSDLGQPVEAARHVFVPDYGTGQVIVVDLDSRTQRRTQAIVEPGGHFDLIDHDGFAFYNQRSSNRAGVIDPDGSVRTVAKYDVDDPGKGVFVPQPDPSTAPSAGPQSASPDTSAAAGSSLIALSPEEAPPSAHPPGTGIPGSAGGDPADPAPSAAGPLAPPSTPTPVTPAAPDPIPTSSTPTPSTPTSLPVSATPSGPESNPAGPSSPSPSDPSSPVGVAPTVDAITISSFPGDGKFLSGDVLTFAVTTSGGKPDRWSWRLRYANDDGTPQNQVEHSSIDPSFTATVDSGGSSFQKWIVDVTVANAAGTDAGSQVFQVDIVDGRPFQVNAVNAAPNPVVTGTQLSVSPSIQGPKLTCEWWIDGATDHQPCDTPLTAPGVGDYSVQVKAVSRQNTIATGSQPLRVKSIDPPTASACAPPAGVGAHENAVITATATGTVTAWHWKILRGTPFQDTGVAGDTAGSFTFVPAVADTFQAEVWVSNAGGDSPHQTCSFTVVDRTPPTHVVTRTDLGGSVKFTLAVTDPESAVTSGSLTVRYSIASGCSDAEGPRQTASDTLTGGSATVTIFVGTCLDTSPGAPLHSFEPNILHIDSITSTATRGGGQADWTD
jgi:hypothetical protein